MNETVGTTFSLHQFLRNRSTWGTPCLPWWVYGRLTPVNQQRSSQTHLMFAFPTEQHFIQLVSAFSTTISLTLCVPLWKIHRNLCLAAIDEFTADLYNQEWSRVFCKDIHSIQVASYSHSGCSQCHRPLPLTKRGACTAEVDRDSTRLNVFVHVYACCSLFYSEPVIKWKEYTPWVRYLRKNLGLRTRFWLVHTNIVVTFLLFYKDIEISVSAID